VREISEEVGNRREAWEKRSINREKAEGREDLLENNKKAHLMGERLAGASFL